MINLAGPWSAEKDYVIEMELRAAGIEPVKRDKPLGEVQSKVTGKLGGFTFERAWYYYRVSGLVPIAMAREMYADPIGQRDVRAAGDCACRPPEQWARAYATAGGFVVCVDHYHIDSAEGLALFVRMAHKHGVVENPIAALGWTVEATESVVKALSDCDIVGVDEYIARAADRGANVSDPHIIDLVRRYKEAHL